MSLKVHSDGPTVQVVNSWWVWPAIVTAEVGVAALTASGALSPCSPRHLLCGGGPTVAIWVFCLIILGALPVQFALVRWGTPPLRLIELNVAGFRLEGRTMGIRTDWEFAWARVAAAPGPRSQGELLLQVEMPRTGARRTLRFSAEATRRILAHPSSAPWRPK